MVRNSSPSKVFKVVVLLTFIFLAGGYLQAFTLTEQDKAPLE